MDVKDHKAGVYKQQYRYKSFSPTNINATWTWAEPKLNTLLAEANRKLGELNAFSLHVPDVDYFIEMHVVKEATTSSRIEGTRTEIEDALLKKEDIEPEKRDDWQEVQNYIKAMNSAIGRLKDIPLSTRLLKETHKILLSKGRGATKLAGEYRTSQNWIGGATINDAVFVPPHHGEVSDLMGDLENFLHNETIDVPDLVRVAIAHYQFETIHPFLDGNGRIGRLMITLYLVSRKLLAKPTLYLSEYFEKHKNLYYDNLMKVRTSNDLLQWIKFFLVAVIETSKKGVSTFEAILKLREKIEGEQIITLGKKLPKAKELINVLYRYPKMTAADVVKAISVTPATANALIKDFVRLKILFEVTGRQRDRKFVFKDYIQLFQK
ncbi:MAG: Fic family protein [Bacteroidota bacterium]|nr:Fic family protein [Bacteroidota bacterium]